MLNSDSPTSLRDEQKALSRRRLIDAAEAVFARSGYHGASVDEIAKEAGATTGALYSNFAGKEDLFLALFEERIATDVGSYSEAVGEGATLAEQARAAGDRWMAILRERPNYFPVLVEFWAHAIRDPELRDRLGERFGELRTESSRIATDAAEAHGLPVDRDAGAQLGTFINALGNGLALEKLADPEAVPDTLFGDLLTIVFLGFEALVREAAAGEAELPAMRDETNDD